MNEDEPDKELATEEKKLNNILSPTV